LPRKAPGDAGVAKVVDDTRGDDNAKGRFRHGGGDYARAAPGIMAR
jgi:hypothetical protein